MRTDLRSSRRGATAVELALILPVFFLFLFAIIEFGHAMMVRGVIVATAKEAARQGSLGDSSTQEIRDLIAQRLGSAFDASASVVFVKDASVFDEEILATVPIDELPDIELAEAESRQPFIVHIRVPYEQVSLFPPFWVTGLEITGDSIVRHE